MSETSQAHPAADYRSRVPSRLPAYIGVEKKTHNHPQIRKTTSKKPPLPPPPPPLRNLQLHLRQHLQRLPPPIVQHEPDLLPVKKREHRARGRRGVFWPVNRQRALVFRPERDVGVEVVRKVDWFDSGVSACLTNSDQRERSDVRRKS